MDVVRLTSTGFIAHLKTVFVQVGEHHQVHLDLPTGDGVTTMVRVLKTYDRSVDPKSHKIERMAEFHFENLTDYHKGVISAFLTAVGQ
jgi:hypothetical protein